MIPRIIEDLWYGEGLGPRLARATLAPAEWSYASAVAIRNAMYDRALIRSHAPTIPVLSLGNLSVGGTGKTPVAAWAAANLSARGAHPAVVMRGYGDDEPLVHARLNPGLIVVADPDRVRGVEQAHRSGADCAILDDGFQHRRLRRAADWVLVAAERWRVGLRALPAGPLRESARALRRADVLIVTRKDATSGRADELLSRLVPSLRDGAHVAVCHLAPDGLVGVSSGAREPLPWLQGRRVLAVAAVGAPASFFAQLASVGAVLDCLAYPDHHAFDARDIARIARASAGCDGVVCTLKDAVKLGPLWPPSAPPLWYVSQHVVFERGGTALDASLGAIFAARVAAPSTAGTAGSSSPAHGHRPSTADR
ncbi:MAG: tetraacyldisaccharide 4'-kinase [Gemmatimonadaceae bacterium]